MWPRGSAESKIGGDVRGFVAQNLVEKEPSPRLELFSQTNATGGRATSPKASLEASAELHPHVVRKLRGLPNLAPMVQKPLEAVGVYSPTQRAFPHLMTPGAIAQTAGRWERGPAS